MFNPCVVGEGDKHHSILYLWLHDTVDAKERRDIFNVSICTPTYSNNWFVVAVYKEANCNILDDLNMDTVKSMGLSGAHDFIWCQVVDDLVNGVFSYHVWRLASES
jgi:hypothetical protein